MKKIAIGGAILASVFGIAAFAAVAGGAMGDHGPTTKEEMLAKVDARFAKMDANNDGKLDAADRDAKLNQRFGEMDANNDGNISKSEFEAGHHKGKMAEDGAKGDKRGGRMGRGHHGAGWMLAMADTNQDKAVSREEFRAAALDMFTRADTNADGTVSVDERKAARDKMRQSGKQGQSGQKAAAPVEVTPAA